jgi:hypothetical protein
MTIDIPEPKKEDKTYEIKIRVLGNEVFAIGITTSTDSNRFIAIGLVAIFCMLTVIGAYGERLIQLYKTLIG